MKHTVMLLFLALVTYTQNVRPILDGHCVECHAPGHNLDLSQFPFSCSITSNQRTIVENILAKVGVNPKMPPGNRPKLCPVDVNTIQQWLDQGLPY